MTSFAAHALLASALAAACVSDSSSGSAKPTAGPAPAEALDPKLVQLNANLPKLGSALPDISALSLDGSQITNVGLHGKTVLLNLWFYH